MVGTSWCRAYPPAYLRSGDDIRVGSLNSPTNEYLAIQNSLRRKARQLYFGRIGYVTQPKTDKRDEYFVRAEVPESGFGIRALHLPNTVVRDYFYFFAQAPSGAGWPYALRTLAGVANSLTGRFAALLSNPSYRARYHGCRRFGVAASRSSRPRSWTACCTIPQPSTSAAKAIVSRTVGELGSYPEPKISNRRRPLCRR